VRGFVRSYARILNVEPARCLMISLRRSQPSSSSVVDGLTQQRDLLAGARCVARADVATSGRRRCSAAPDCARSSWRYATRESAPRSTAGAVVPAASCRAGAPPAPLPSRAGHGDNPRRCLRVLRNPRTAEPIPPPHCSSCVSVGRRGRGQDAEGKVLHSQHNTAGTEFVIEGTPPFYVVIGDVTKTSVEVRGEAYDSVRTAAEVARFTIN